MAQVEFEPMIPMIEQVKTVHALNCAATVIDIQKCRKNNKKDSTLCPYVVQHKCITKVRQVIET
jgi:hypothetical protein